MNIHKKFFIITLLIVSNVISTVSHNVDLVIFSYDRPLQLFALLESIEQYVYGLGTTHIIYRASSEQMNDAYNEVQNRFSNATYIAQGSAPQADFKPLTLQAVFDSPSAYIIFAVDDDVMTDYVDLDECVELMEQYQAYGFYLRLGNNITECYTEGHAYGLPTRVEVQPNVLAWNFKDGRGDWGYPNTVDLTLFRKKTIEPLFRSLNYRAPNSLEGTWAAHGQQVVATQIGLCYMNAKMVNLPLNIVQAEWHNKNMNFMTPQEMLTVFNEGKKIDIQPLYQIKNKAPHMAYEPTFITR
ncbi:MAG: hypothetical protein NTX86_01305 [Candidatus Dependentiae bacterium]|nr:hypothetical protein [Candidatus Dependentiae bacterium]